jgi:hypothetical protein
MLFVKSVTSILKKAIALCDQAIEAAQVQHLKHREELISLEKKAMAVRQKDAETLAEMNTATKLRAKLSEFTEDTSEGLE